MVDKDAAEELDCVVQVLDALGAETEIAPGIPYSVHGRVGAAIEMERAKHADAVANIDESDSGGAAVEYEVTLRLLELRAITATATIKIFATEQRHVDHFVRELQSLERAVRTLANEMLDQTRQRLDTGGTP